MSDAPHTPSSTCPPIEDWTLYVNWVDGIDDLRRGRRYEREGRILKKRPEADGDDSHSDGEMEVLNREENVDFDPEVDPAELPLIVSPGGTCYLQDEARERAGRCTNPSGPCRPRCGQPAAAAESPRPKGPLRARRLVMSQ